MWKEIITRGSERHECRFDSHFCARTLCTHVCKYVFNKCLHANTHTNMHTGVKRMLKWLADWMAGTAKAVGRTDLNILMPDSRYADTRTNAHMHNILTYICKYNIICCITCTEYCSSQIDIHRVVATTYICLYVYMYVFVMALALSIAFIAVKWTGKTKTKSNLIYNCIGRFYYSSIMLHIFIAFVVVDFFNQIKAVTTST